MFQTKICKVGNSSVVTLTAEMLAALDAKEGDLCVKWNLRVYSNCYPLCPLPSAVSCRGCCLFYPRLPNNRILMSPARISL